MLGINPTISVITLNMNGIITPIKRHIFFRVGRKTRSNYLLSIIKPHKYKHSGNIKVKGWKKISHAVISKRKLQ